MERARRLSFALVLVIESSLAMQADGPLSSNAGRRPGIDVLYEVVILTISCELGSLLK